MAPLPTHNVYSHAGYQKPVQIKQSCNIWIFQVLGFLEEFGGLTDEFYEVYYQPALPPFPLHCSLCPAWDAVVWWQVSRWASKARHVFLKQLLVFLNIS